MTFVCFCVVKFDKQTIEKSMKYEVVFYDYSDDEIVVNQKFDTESDAEKWADGLKYDYEDIAIDQYGNDYWKTFYRYYNPEDNESYFNYSVRGCITCH